MHETIRFEALTETGHGGARVQTEAGGIKRLSLPAGNKSGYRLAQLDDTGSLSRSRLQWTPPCDIEIQMRLSERDLPGTWGFGFWNDPFSMGLIQAGAGRLLPALPQCAWFFSASPPNHLSIYDRVPGSGFFYGLMRSMRLPVWALLPGVIGLPLLLFPAGVRLLRRLARVLIKQEGSGIDVDVTEWHTYRLNWQRESVSFGVDGKELAKFEVSPVPPLGLVIWIDNQYAAVTPEGKVRSGAVANPECWMDVRLTDSREEAAR